MPTCEHLFLVQKSRFWDIFWDTFYEKPLTGRSVRGFSGESEIRTRDTLLGYTRFPGVPLQPLEHLSKVGTANIRKKSYLVVYFKKNDPLHEI